MDTPCRASPVRSVPMPRLSHVLLVHVTYYSTCAPRLVSQVIMYHLIRTLLHHVRYVTIRSLDEPL
jgi:hypothetical protein